MTDDKEFIEFDIWSSEQTPKRDRFCRFASIAVQFKHNGKWRVHKSDPDKVFPSDFHADRVDKPEKIDLYDGSVCSKTTNTYLYGISEKQMRRIYDDLDRRCESFLDEYLARRDRFTYLKD